MMKKYLIIDNVNGMECCFIQAINEKLALSKFCNEKLSSWLYNIEKQNGKYHLVNSFGSDFVAKKIL